MLLCDDLHMDEGFKFCFVANSEGYQELQPVMSDFADILIDLFPKEGTKFTATVPVF